MKGALRRKIKGVLVDLPRLMFVRCSPAFRMKVDSVKHLLKDKVDETSHLRYAIRPHLPDSHYGARLRFNAMVKGIIKDNESLPDKDKSTFQFRGEEFYVDKFRVVDKVSAPSLHATCVLTLPQRNQLKLLSFVESSVKQEKNSKFQAFAISIYGIEQLNNAYLRMRCDHTRASHICLGYKYAEDDTSPPLHGAVHDGEYQADVTLLNLVIKGKMNNYAVFVVRRYGGVHIGNRRLTLIQEVAMEAINALCALRGEIFSGSEHEEDSGDDATSAKSFSQVVAGSSSGSPSSQSKKRQRKKNQGRGGGAPGGGDRGSRGGRGGGASSRGRAPRKPKLNVTSMNVSYV